MLPKCRLPRCPITKMSVTKMSYYRNVLLPKCPVTEMSCYRNVSYQNVHYQSVLYRNVLPVQASTALLVHTAYTDLLQAYPVLKTYHNHCPKP